MKIIYCCSDCGIKIDRRTALVGKGHCKTCSLKYQKGSGNPMFGKKLKTNHPFYFQKGKQHPYYNKRRQKHSDRMKGKNNPNYKNGKYLKNYYCIICNKPITIGASYCKKCFCQNILLKNKFCRYLYKNIYFKSLWEANFAKWLDLSGIKWQYESKTFDLGNTIYTPDFYLPEFDCYIEIKGYLTIFAKEKLKLFFKIFKNINLQIYDVNILKYIGII
jgi:hypothetical protein